jgi:16S rRNA (uracil1498-N3)-methyltransferase
MLELATDADLVLFCYECEVTCSLRDVLSEAFAGYKKDGKIPRVSIVVGSEGGFSVEEAERARERGCRLVGLGPRILRTETAGAFVLGCLVYESEL